jgi:hypothetical protein
MQTIDYIRKKQILWAKRHNVDLSSSNGQTGLQIYTTTLNDNLFQPLIKETETSFLKADGNELNSLPQKKSKMNALHSSSAIAVNVFQYWLSKNKISQIAHSCGFCDKGNPYSLRLKFEEKFQIDKRFRYSPNIDIIIENSEKSNYQLFAIESKFSEPFNTYRKNKNNGIDNKYLHLNQVWEDIPELFKCAKEISPENNEFKYFDAVQLIKHILGLKIKDGKKAFRLLYLYYDAYGKDSYYHCQEIEKFTHIAKSDGIKFHSLSYQELITRMYQHYYDKENEAYFKYISDRYL